MPVAAIDPIKRNNVTVTGNLAAERTIVFSHGFGTEQSVWRKVAAPFAADFRIVLLDHVGAGAAAPDAFVQHQYLNLNRYASDLFEVCDALKLRDITLIGHSVGAMVGALAAINHPESFSKLVLMGASPRYLDDENYRGGFSKSDINGLYDSIVKGPSWADSFALAMMGNHDRPELSTQFADSLKTIPPDRVLTVLCSVLQSDYRKEIGKLKVPTLLIQTMNDYAVPLEVAEYMNQQIPGSRLKVIEADGHLPHVSAPEKVIDAISAFIRE